MFKIKKNWGFIRRKEFSYIVGIGLFMFLAILRFLTNGSKEQELTEEMMKRPAYGEPSSALPLKIYAEGEEMPQEMNLQLAPKAYTADEANTLFEDCYDDLLAEMLGENSSLDLVQTKLNLLTQLQGSPITIQWYSDHNELVDYAGNVLNDTLKEGDKERVTLTALMECDSYQCMYEIDITVIPKSLSEKASFWKEVEFAMSKAAEDTVHQEYIKLPQTVSGKHLRYYTVQESASPGTIIMLGGFSVAALLWGRKQQKKDYEKKRKRQLSYDYSEMVSKLALLMGAGMTVRKAWEKIVLDYQKQKKQQNRKKRYVYEEMTNSFHQMKAGISEGLVYEQFGRNCNTKEYLKFSALLIQNMRKGTKNLIKMFEQEREEAFEDRKNMAKQLGEEAGTKLLFPMILMLGVVMIIIILPAMSSFNV